MALLWLLPCFALIGASLVWTVNLTLQEDSGLSGFFEPSQLGQVWNKTIWASEDGAQEVAQTAWTSPAPLTLCPPGSGAPAGDSELSIMPRIINGLDARPGSSPWHVSLETPSGGLLCGGSLVNRTWVLTAAHCSVTTSDWVVAGMFDRRAHGNKIQYLRIAKIFKHPEYHHTTFYGDIALLKLSTPADFHRSVSAIALSGADDSFSFSSQCKIMGWGLTHPNDSKKPDKLQEATVPILPFEVCKKHWGFQFTYDMICVGGNGVCSYLGDVGGSLVCKKNGVWKLLGIILYGSKSCPTSRPMVAISLRNFKPWIEYTVTHK
ncbi:Chymotrypsinogen A [Galemys pyrenaicus]|uniref:Chymotrypsinogen A n=1 Tax=Galemys pyrenaicus TaxID=202257 RepID=A0A8J6A9J5_GALPY|nr:Chymotrypsinogen A [Galemys pyrenaicus]